MKALIRIKDSVTLYIVCNHTGCDVLPISSLMWSLTHRYTGGTIDVVELTDILTEEDVLGVTSKSIVLAKQFAVNVSS